MSFQSPNKSRKVASTAILQETWVAQSCGICKSSLVLTTTQHPNFPDAWLKVWKLNTSRQSGSMEASVKAPETDSCPTGGVFFTCPPPDLRKQAQVHSLTRPSAAAIAKEPGQQTKHGFWG